MFEVNFDMYQNSIFSTRALEPFWDGPTFFVFSVCPKRLCFCPWQEGSNSAEGRTFFSPKANCLSGREAPLLLLTAAGGF